MYNIAVSMHYLEKFGELLTGDRTNAENYLRQLVKHILLEFFVAATIDQVSIHPLSGLEEESEYFSACIAAHCISKDYPLVPQELTCMELALEARISCALLELVGMVDVEDVSIVNLTTQEKQVLFYHC